MRLAILSQFSRGAIMEHAKGRILPPFRSALSGTDTHARYALARSLPSVNQRAM